MFAFDYTHENLYGDQDTRWIHGWTGDHGVTGKLSYLAASIVDIHLRLPLISIPSPMGNDMPEEVSGIVNTLVSIFGQIDLDHIIARYNFRWRIETMFRVQDECRIRTKSKDIRVRYFLFAYDQLVESIWYLFYHREVIFKRYLMDLSETC